MALRGTCWLRYTLKLCFLQRIFQSAKFSLVLLTFKTLFSTNLGLLTLKEF